MAIYYQQNANALGNIYPTAAWAGRRRLSHGKRSLSVNFYPAGVVLSWLIKAKCQLFSLSCDKVLTERFSFARKYALYFRKQIISENKKSALVRGRKLKMNKESFPIVGFLGMKGSFSYSTLVSARKGLFSGKSL
jgi:hypothetical protein